MSGNTALKLADNGRRLQSPFKVGGQAFSFLAGGVNGAVQRSWPAGWPDIGVATPLKLLLGGSEELTRPLEENEWLYACAAAKASAVGSVRFVIWQSDD